MNRGAGTPSTSLRAGSAGCPERASRSARPAQPIPTLSISRLPAHAHRNRPQIGAYAAVRAVQIAEFAVNLDVRADLARDPRAEVLPPLVLAGGNKIPVERKAGIEAVAPPGKKGVAGRSGNGGRRIQFSRAMEETAPGHDVPTPQRRDWNIDDGIEIERVDMAGRAARLRLFRHRGGEGQV